MVFHNLHISPFIYEQNIFFFYAGITLGSILLILGAVILFHVYKLKKLERNYQVKIEKFLEDYEALKLTRYSYAAIKKITDQFKEKLGEGGYGTV